MPTGHNGAHGAQRRSRISAESELELRLLLSQWPIRNSHQKIIQKMYVFLDSSPTGSESWFFFVFLEAFPIQIIWKIFFLEYMMAKTTEIGKIRIGKYYWMTYIHIYIYIYIYICGGDLWGIFRPFHENYHMCDLQFGLFTGMCITAPWECINHCRCTRGGKIHCK